MLLETLLASVHLLALLGAVVFATSQAALCRPEWMSATVAQRLRRLDTLFWAMLAVLLLSGVARVLWGMKGWQWYVSQPLFHAKMLLLAITLALAARASLGLRRWADQAALPDAAALRRVRRLIMWHTHLMPLLVVLAVFWARGWWPRVG